MPTLCARNVFVVKAALLLYSDFVSLYILQRNNIIRHPHDLWGQYICNIMHGHERFQAKRHQIVERLAAVSAYADGPLAGFTDALLTASQARIETLPEAHHRACELNPGERALYSITVLKGDTEFEVNLCEEGAALVLLFHEFLNFEHDVMAFASTVSMTYENRNFERTPFGEYKVTPIDVAGDGVAALGQFIFAATSAWNSLSPCVRAHLEKRLETLCSSVEYINESI